MTIPNREHETGSMGARIKDVRMLPIPVIILIWLILFLIALLFIDGCGDMAEDYAANEKKENLHLGHIS